MNICSYISINLPAGFVNKKRRGFYRAFEKMFYAFFGLGSWYSMPSSKRTDAGGSSSSSG